MYVTTVSSGSGQRSIKNSVTGEIVSSYATGNLQSRQNADAAAHADWAEMLNELIGLNLIVAGREYSLPNLQAAWARKLAAEAAEAADNAADAAEDALYARFVARLIDDEYISE